MTSVALYTAVVYMTKSAEEPAVNGEVRLCISMVPIGQRLESVVDGAKFID